MLGGTRSRAQETVNDTVIAQIKREGIPAIGRDGHTQLAVLTSTGRG